LIELNQPFSKFGETLSRSLTRHRQILGLQASLFLTFEKEQIPNLDDKASCYQQTPH